MTHTFSYWEQNTFLNNFDVIVIGSGIVGLNSAMHLKKSEPSLNICVLEAGFLPSGASTKNAGFACFGSISEAIDEIQSSSENEFLELVEMRWKGLERLRDNLGDKALDFQQNGGYELFRPGEKLLSEQCVDAIPYFNTLLGQVIGKHDIYSVSNEKIADFGLNRVDQLILNKFEGQIDTGKMMRALLSKVQGYGIPVFNNCEVFSISSEGRFKTVLTNRANFTCEKIVVATNAFVRKLLPDLDVVPGRGQVLVTAPVPGLKVEGAFHYNRGYTYFRNINGRILLGGGRDLDFETEQTFEPGNTDVVQNYLENLLNEMIVPNARVKIDYRWSGVMGFGKQLMPIVKEVQPHLVCAVRCSGMGVAMGSLLGEQAAEKILNS